MTILKSTKLWCIYLKSKSTSRWKYIEFVLTCIFNLLERCRVDLWNVSLGTIITFLLITKLPSANPEVSSPIVFLLTYFSPRVGFSSLKVLSAHLTYGGTDVGLIFILYKEKSYKPKPHRKCKLVPREAKQHSLQCFPQAQLSNWWYSE